MRTSQTAIGSPLAGRVNPAASDKPKGAPLQLPLSPPPADRDSAKAYDLIIIGGGPAGLAAGLMAARMQLRSVLVDRGPLGGQLLNTELVEDYPGFESVLGAELARKMGDHARRFGLEVREFQPVAKVHIEGDLKVVRLEDGAELRAPAAIVATGGLPRRLGVLGESELAGRGVSYCAVCDGPFFKGKVLAVVGGGDAALEEAEFLTRYATKVYVFHRRDRFRAQPIIQARALADPKIEPIMSARVLEILGDESVEALTYERGGQLKKLDVGGVFIFVGFLPNSDLFAFHVDHDELGYLTTNGTMQTSMAGLWAVGDVRAQLTRQIATAVGDGTTAAVAASAYVERWWDGRRGTASGLSAKTSPAA